jgi:hypothetical protein
MSAAYLSHFDLRQAPFSKEIVDADLWVPPSKHAVPGPMASEMARNAMAMAPVPAIAWIAFGLPLAAASAGIARALFRGLAGGLAS